MSNLTDLSPTSQPTPAPETYEAVVSEDAVAGQPVYVVIPEFDPNLNHGPCPWIPIVTSTGIFYPKKGDLAVVIQPAAGDPWIATWTASATTPDVAVGTTYTAGDGLDLTGTEFSTDLKSGGGLKIDATELAADFGTGAGKVTQGNDARLGTYVTSLPGLPSDGDEIYFAADAANGVIWHLRYRAAASGSYKWEFLGGPPIVRTVLTSETRSTTTFGDLTTVGPTVTAPLAGDYEISIGLTGTHPINGGVALASVYAGAPATDDDSCAFSGGSATMYHSPSKTVLKTGLSASAAIKLQYRSDGATATFFRRWISVLPVRVG